MADLNVRLTVQELRSEADGYLSIVFAHPPEVKYGPGDWMDIRFPTPQFPVGKTYSFASSPTEPDVLITFKVGVSAFKRKLATVQPGDEMLITQYGSNGFVHDRRSPSVFIAGGVGITPFRSMIKYAMDTHHGTAITLVYLNHSNDFPFKHELDEWQRSAPSLHVHYVVTERDGRLTAGTLRRIAPEITDTRVYIAGPPSMVNATTKRVVTLGIPREAIRVDSFDGY